MWLGLIKDFNCKISLLLCYEFEMSMEVVIYYFKFVIEGFYLLFGEVYVFIELVCGEVGYYVIFDGGFMFYCVKIWVLSFVNL